MKTIKQLMKRCAYCNRATLHNGNAYKINWMMHIALMFVGGLGMFTLLAALVMKAGAPAEQMVCSLCGSSESE